MPRVDTQTIAWPTDQTTNCLSQIDRNNYDVFRFCLQILFFLRPLKLKEQKYKRTQNLLTNISNEQLQPIEQLRTNEQRPKHQKERTKVTFAITNDRPEQYQNPTKIEKSSSSFSSLFHLRLMELEI